jgi:cobalt-zinc-cadmium resistance protein CzcA
MTNTQVQVITEAPGLSPIEVEQYVTYPVETTMRGLPHVIEARSVSKFGISSLTIVFDEGTDISHARQLVNERLTHAQARLAGINATPEMGPMATALGEVLQFEVRWVETPGYRRRDAMELRTLLEWEIAPQMRQVRGSDRNQLPRRLLTNRSRWSSTNRMAQDQVGLMK